MGDGTVVDIRVHDSAEYRELSVLIRHDGQSKRYQRKLPKPDVGVIEHKDAEAAVLALYGGELSEAIEEALMAALRRR